MRGLAYVLLLTAGLLFTGAYFWMVGKLAFAPVPTRREIVALNLVFAYQGAAVALGLRYSYSVRGTGL